MIWPGISYPIEACAQLEGEDGAGNVHYDPRENNVRHIGHGHKCGSSVEKEKVRMIGQPYGHPGFDKLTPGDMEAPPEGPDVSSACQRRDESVYD